MARKRFSDLERILDGLRLGNVDPSTLPQNLDFVKYALFKQGDAPERNITRPSLGDPVQAGIIAFGLEDTDAAAKIQLTWNTRAKNFYDGLSNSNLFGIELTTLTDYNENRSFVPAQVSLQARGATQTETSGITGRKYQKNSAPSYTIPLGQTTTVKHFQKAVQGLLDSQLGTNYFISVSEEQWRRD
ncbi:MAG: hypothetical protein QNJ33_12275 [Crocosphaera sp.]|nr:hypothetical protein [Crocosphaera sp.]